MRWKQLENVPPEQAFKLRNGHEIKNMDQLYQHLEVMDEDVYNHHVNKRKNDFKKWVMHVLEDCHLAEKIGKSKNRQHMANTVQKRVRKLTAEKQHHEKVDSHGIKWGIKEFGIGLVTGLFIGLVFLRALGRI